MMWLHSKALRWENTTSSTTWGLMHAAKQISAAFAHKRMWHHQLYWGREVREASRHHTPCSGDVLKLQWQAKFYFLYRSNKTSVGFFCLFFVFLLFVGHYSTVKCWIVLNLACIFQEQVSSWSFWTCPALHLSSESPSLTPLFTSCCSSWSNIDRGQPQSKDTPSQFLMYNIVPQMAFPPLSCFPRQILAYQPLWFRI